MTDNRDITEHEVYDAVVRATRTVRLLPKGGPRSSLTYWPDYVRSYHGTHDGGRTRVVVTPSARALTELDGVMLWLSWLAREHGAEYGRILWSAASGAPWRAIAGRVGLAPQTVKSRCVAAVLLVARALRAGDPALKGAYGSRR